MWGDRDDDKDPQKEIYGTVTIKNRTMLLNKRAKNLNRHFSKENKSHEDTFSHHYSLGVSSSVAVTNRYNQRQLGEERVCLSYTSLSW